MRLRRSEGCTATDNFLIIHCFNVWVLTLPVVVAGQEKGLNGKAENRKKHTAVVMGVEKLAHGRGRLSK